MYTLKVVNKQIASRIKEFFSIPTELVASVVVSVVAEVVGIFVVDVDVVVAVDDVTVVVVL